MRRMRSGLLVAMIGVLASAAAALAAVQAGDLVLAQWSGGSFYEGTVKSVDGASAVIAWKDGTEPSPVELERVLALPKAGEKPTVEAGALGFCGWQGGAQWWDCRVTAVGDNGPSVVYTYDGTVADVTWNEFVLPTGKVAEELAARAAGGSSGSSDSGSSDSSASSASDPNAGFDPTLKNNDSDTYEYDLDCGGGSTHTNICGPCTQTLSKGCTLKIFGQAFELKGNMNCEISSGSISCR